MVRQPSCWNKTWLKKGTWSHDEDQKLIAYIMRYGIWNWNEMPKYAGLSRSGKSCRLRWMNYLRPNIRRGNFTREEEETIIQLQSMLGNRWSAIAARLPQRTDNDIKNYWNTRLKKRVANNNSPSVTTPTSTTEIIHGGIEALAEQGNSSDVVGSPMFLDTLLDLDSPVPMLDYFPEEPTTCWNHQLPPLAVVNSDDDECQKILGNSQLWLPEPIYFSDSYYDLMDYFWINPYI